ncbi:autotransporter domain-containing protein [Hydromonas duriensis]|uniref:Outer membrane lipase/esterase n=1 Tax=Hydromonas duriensis TaxID=1527608 RepID=A0A4R6YBF7_9BURK|nr:autotransporter domain-containing protein [Hydromonas duriensis]TDR32962.1 outer membrane lipase/esterase [Hydromonas duriensis]
MRTFIRSTLPLFVSSALMGIAFNAHAYDNVVIFGDSLSDGGIYGSRFTTNPGLTAAEYFAQGLGFTTTPSTTGGTNYAQGGARVASASSTQPANLQRSVATQLSTEYFSKTNNLANGNTVYVIQGGANDIFQNLEQVQSGAITQATMQQNLITAGTAFAQQVSALQLAGAKYIVVPNVPNLGATPAFAGALSSTGSALASGFNSVVKTALTTFGTNVAVLDVYSLVNEVASNPTSYGFTNASSPACTSTLNGQLSSLACTPSTLVSPNAASTYVFADGVHPTDAMHKLTGQYMLSVLNAPTQISLLSAAPLAGSMSRLRNLAMNTPHAGNQTWHTFADYDHTPTKFGEAKSTANNFLVGVDRKLGSGRLGLSVGYQKYDGSFGSGAGGFDINEPSVGLYYNLGLAANSLNANITASLNYGKLSVSNLKRNITLGSNTRTETGDTSGSHWSLGIAADATVGSFANNAFKHGPTVSLSYEDIKLDAFDEQSNLSTAMSYGAQSRHGFLASLGYQVKGDLGRFKPYAKVAYELNGTRGSDVNAHVKSTYSSFSTPALETADGFRAELGTAVDITPAINAHIGLGSTFAKDSGKETSFNIGIDAKF